MVKMKNMCKKNYLFKKKKKNLKILSTDESLKIKHVSQSHPEKEDSSALTLSYRFADPDEIFLGRLRGRATGAREDVVQ